MSLLLSINVIVCRKNVGSSCHETLHDNPACDILQTGHRLHAAIAGDNSGSEQWLHRIHVAGGWFEYGLGSSARSPSKTAGFDSSTVNALRASFLAFPWLGQER